MQKIDVAVELTVKCEKCGGELAAEYDTRRAILKVEPCESCLDDEFGRGRAVGLGENSRED